MQQGQGQQGSQNLQQAISQIETSAQELRNASNQVQDQQSKNTFQSAAKQIEDTVQRCRTTLGQMQGTSR